ncbi:MAG: hypothetical protein QOJ13_1547 [Gaiellales bacterium]|nr:hypothetical protein [Gaiellales bacterium]
MHLSDAHHSRKTLAGACMVVAPLVLLAAMVIHPASDMDEATQVATIADNLDAWYLAHLLALVSIALMVPAVLGLMHMLREREVALGHLGGGLALLGSLVLMLFWGVALMQWQMVRGAGDRTQMTSLLDRFMHTTGTQVFLFLGLALTIGLVVLALGLWRARAVHWSIAGALAAGAVVLQAGFFVGNEAAYFIVASAILFVALATMGRMVLTETDEAWEHTPEHTGFRAVTGH